MTMAEVKTTHKPYKTLVEGAIVSLKEIESQIIDPLTKSGRKRFKGVSVATIVKFILENNEFPDEKKATSQIKIATKRMLTDEKIVNSTGKGLTGKLKLSEEKVEKKPIKKRGRPKNSGSGDENESSEETVEKKEAPKKKGIVPKSKAESKVVKKAVNKVVNKKKTKPVADLTKPRPGAKRLPVDPELDESDKENEFLAPIVNKKAATKTAKKPKIVAKKNLPVPEMTESDSEPEQLISPKKPAAKAAPKGKAPKNNLPAPEMTDSELEEELPSPKKPAAKAAPKGKGKAAKKPAAKAKKVPAKPKAPVYTESESGSEHSE